MVRKEDFAVKFSFEMLFVIPDLLLCSNVVLQYCNAADEGGKLIY